MSRFTIKFQGSPSDEEQLRALQSLFVDACNFVAVKVVATRCWSRVGLHHLAYRAVRERYPQLGSQMVSNAIYSVSRACRRIYQDPDSKWFIGRDSRRPLPLLHFLPDSPVFFDRHTLSIRDEVLSLFSLDGRLRLKVGISPQLRLRFEAERLREVILVADKERGFLLSFVFGASLDSEGSEAPNLHVIVQQGEFV